MASGSWLLTTGGAWNNNANWSAAFPNTLTDTATIATDLTADETITLGQAISVGSMTFSDNGAAGNAWTIAPGGAFALTLGTSTITTTTNATISAAVAGSAAVTKAGAGTLTLSGGGTNTGAWAVNAGTLVVTTAALTGTTGAITVASGATLTSSAAISKPITVNSGSTGNTVVLAGSAALSVSGTITTSGTSTRATTVTATGNLTSNGSIGTLAVTAGGIAVINGNTAAMTLNGTGTTLGAGTSTGAHVIGNVAGNAVVTIAANRTLTNGAGPALTAASVAGSYAAIYQTGSNSVVSATLLGSGNGIYIGETSASGYYLGTGAGSSLSSAQGYIFAGVVDLNGTSLSGGFVYVGYNTSASGQIAFRSGSHTLTASLYLGLSGAVGVYNTASILNSNVTITSLQFFGDTTSANLLTIGSGGTLTTSTTSSVSGTAANQSISLVSGGTLVANATIPIPVTLYGTGNKLSSTGTGTISGSIRNASGSGISSITSTAGSGYVGAPLLKISGTGTEAVARAIWDSATNTITEYVIDCPGSGFTADPTITPVGGGFTSAVSSFTVTRSANSTDGAVEKLGSGTLALSGTNTNTGDYTVSAGTLRIGNTGAAGTLGNNDTSNASVASGATLAFGRSDARTYNNIISGAGTIAVNGGGRATLSGVNTFTSAAAAIAISTANSALRVTNNDSIGQGTAFGITVASGTAFEIDGTSGNITGLPAKALSLTGTGISSGGALRNIAGSNSYPGTITLTAASRINSDAGTLSLTAGSPITGTNFSLTFGGAGDITVNQAINTVSGTLTKDGTGFTDLRGLSSYAGQTTVSAGTLGYATAPVIGQLSSLGQVASNFVNVAGNAVAASAGGIRFTGTTDQTFNRTVNITGTNAAGLAVRIEASSNTAKVTHSAAFTNATTNQPRTYQFGGTGTTLNTVSFLVANNGTGAVGITKADAGRWVLSNTGNTYTGATAVNAGTLGLSVATWSAGAKVTSTSTVTVNAGAKIQTFAGSGGSAQNGRHTYSNLTFAANGRIRIGG